MKYVYKCRVRYTDIIWHFEYIAVLLWIRASLSTPAVVDGGSEASKVGALYSRVTFRQLFQM